MLAPATPSAAFAVGEKGGRDPVEMYLNDVFTVPVNLAGLPGISVPGGLSADGLPLGLQLIGRPLGEETLFSLANVIQQAGGRVSPEWRWEYPPDMRLCIRSRPEAHGFPPRPRSAF